MASSEKDISDPENLDEALEQLELGDLETREFSPKNSSELTPKGVSAARVENWEPERIVLYAKATPIAGNENAVVFTDPESGEQISEGFIEYIGPSVYSDPMIDNLIPEHPHQTANVDDWTGGIEMRDKNDALNDLDQVRKRLDNPVFELMEENPEGMVVPVYSEGDISTTIMVRDTSTPLVNREIYDDKEAELRIDTMGNLYEEEFLTYENADGGFEVRYAGDVIYQENEGSVIDSEVSGDVVMMEVKYGSSRQ